MTRLQFLTYTAFAVFMSAVLAWGLSAQQHHFRCVRSVQGGCIAWISAHTPSRVCAVLTFTPFGNLWVVKRGSVTEEFSKQDTAERYIERFCPTK